MCQQSKMCPRPALRGHSRCMQCLVWRYANRYGLTRRKGYSARRANFVLVMETRWESILDGLEVPEPEKVLELFTKSMVRWHPTLMVIIKAVDETARRIRENPDGSQEDRGGQ